MIQSSVSSNATGFEIIIVRKIGSCIEFCIGSAGYTGFCIAMKFIMLEQLNRSHGLQVRVVGTVILGIKPGIGCPVFSCTPGKGQVERGQGMAITKDMAYCG